MRTAGRSYRYIFSLWSALSNKRLQLPGALALKETSDSAETEQSPQLTRGP
jgi:hypothetical protein